MPPDTGAAFVLLQHLDREHQTRMLELLRQIRQTDPLPSAWGKYLPCKE
jgi:hypothetical protein